MNTIKKKPSKTYGKKKGVSKSGVLFENFSPVAVKKVNKLVEEDVDEDDERLAEKEILASRKKGMLSEKEGMKEEEENGGEVVDLTSPSTTPRSSRSVRSTKNKERKDEEEGCSVETAASTTFEHDSTPKDVGHKHTIIVANSHETLDDITAALDTLAISKPHVPSPEAQAPQSPPFVIKPKRTPASNPHIPSIAQPTLVTRQTRNGNSQNQSRTPTPPLDKRLDWLSPLLDAYEDNGHPRPQIKDWNSALDPSWPLLKIAESSYAEVYKVTNPSGTSILKIMALKPPSGAGSRRETACTVESVISEVLIMDLMADIPGYLVFRDMHLISGRPPQSVVAAWEAHDWGVSLLDSEGEETNNEGESNSTFPHPAKYNKDAVFLVLELGDAGVDVEHYVVKSVVELWDVVLGIVVALATGEEVCGFEHRDLHEGNVCVKRVRPASSPPPPTVGTDQDAAPKHRFGYSGLEVIILDYTLSRALNPHTGEIIAFNLEENQELFWESEMLQHQIYRRMKNYVFFGAHTLNHSLTDDEDTSWERELNWKDHHPYTNVLWIYYQLSFLLKEFRGPKDQKAQFEGDTEELRRRLDPDLPIAEGGFGSAREIRAYCVERGWLRPEDTNDMLEVGDDSRLLSRS